MNQSLRAAAAETRRSEWRKHQALPSRLARSRTRRQADKGLLARLDHTSPIDLIAARYPAVRRLIGAGFGGLSTAKQLAQAPFDVTIVDRHNYHYSLGHPFWKVNFGTT